MSISHRFKKKRGKVGREHTIFSCMKGSSTPDTADEDLFPIELYFVLFLFNIITQHCQTN